MQRKLFVQRTVHVVLFSCKYGCVPVDELIEL